MGHRQIWLDKDGVLANFNKRAELILGMPPSEYDKLHGPKAFDANVYAQPDFFALLEPMEDAHELVASVKHLKPIILTGHPNNGYWAVEQKFKWRDNNFPDLPLVSCLSKDKPKFCRPGDILIDDWSKYKTNWEEASGVFIHHVSAKQSISQLKELGII